MVWGLKQKSDEYLVTATQQSEEPKEPKVKKQESESRKEDYDQGPIARDWTWRDTSDSSDSSKINIIDQIPEWKVYKAKTINHNSKERRLDENMRTWEHGLLIDWYGSNI